MMDGLAFLPVPDLTNGIHLLRTLCTDDPPEAAELLDYFDSTYIPTPSNYKGIILNETLIYENQNLIFTHLTLSN
jgi:hypothetical protein